MIAPDLDLVRVSKDAFGTVCMALEVVIIGLVQERHVLIYTDRFQRRDLIRNGVSYTHYDNLASRRMH